MLRGKVTTALTIAGFVFLLAICPLRPTASELLRPMPC